MLKKISVLTFLFISSIVTYISCSTTNLETKSSLDVVEVDTKDYPKTMREFRAAWVATVATTPHATPRSLRPPTR